MSLNERMRSTFGTSTGNNKVTRNLFILAVVIVIIVVVIIIGIFASKQKFVNYYDDDYNKFDVRNRR